MEFYLRFMNPFNSNMQFIDHEMFFLRFNRVLQCHMPAQRLSNCIRSTKTTHPKCSESTMISNKLQAMNS